MKTALFDFNLPEYLIASRPLDQRDAARMLVIDKGTCDQHISDLTRYLKPNDVMVFNNTRVIPARLFGKRGDTRIEFLLHKQLVSSQQSKTLWQCFAKPAKKLKVGDIIIFAEDFSAKVIEKREDGQVIISFDCSSKEHHKKLIRYGHMPLPPYIARKDEAVDIERYQTVYAKHDGSVAAPTAGLHFTSELLSAIDGIGVKRAEITLHVGGGTFLPVKVDDTENHVMHSERAIITEKTAELINKCKANGGRVIAVGTTSLRSLESATNDMGILQPFDQETDIFITPGYKFKMVDMLLTNFHLPKSTLFMLVSAFSGMGRMKAAYLHAIAEEYRFYSYGDACLLFPEQ